MTNIPTLPTPPVNLSVSPTVGWAFNIGMAIVLVITIFLLGRASLRERTWVWIVSMPTFALCYFLEPIGDILGLTWYAADTPLVINLMGRPLPLWILLTYATYLPLGFWLCYLVMRKGAMSTRTTLNMWIGGAVAAFAYERLLIIGPNLSHYYGDNPTFIFQYPLYSIIQNGALPVAGAAFMMWARIYLKGWKVLWLIPLAPAFTLAFLTAASWPSYVALNSQWSHSIQWVAGTVSVIFNLALYSALLFSKQLRELCDRTAAMDRNGFASAPHTRQGTVESTV